MPSYQDHSKRHWQDSIDENSYPGDHKMKIGCLQRIAAATEKMSSSFVELEEDRDMWKMLHANAINRGNTAEKRLFGQKAAATRARRERDEARDALRFVFQNMPESLASAIIVEAQKQEAEGSSSSGLVGLLQEAQERAGSGQ